MADEVGPILPMLPLKEAVAEKLKMQQAAVDLVLADIGSEETGTRATDHITLRKLVFSGEKIASAYQDGPYTFEWPDLSSGLFAVLSEGANQIGKSTVLEIMLWALRGRPRNLKPEVRAWINTVDLEFTIGPDRYRVEFTDFSGVPRGKVVIVAPAPARILKTFEGDEAFETVMGDLMMNRFSLQPIPNVSHAGDEITSYQHSWTAYAASMFIEGSHPAILGDVTVGALWWRMLHLFVGMPYAATHMALRNAVVLEQSQQDGAVSQRSKQDGYAAAIKRLEDELKGVINDLKQMGVASVNPRDLDSLTLDYSTALRALTSSQEQLAAAERNHGILKSERDEARSALRRLSEGAASKRMFAGLKPVCCPRCAEAIPDSRTKGEEAAGRCSVCDRTTLQEDQEALNDAVNGANERVSGLSQAETAAQAKVDFLTNEVTARVKAKADANSKIEAVERQLATLAERRKVEENKLKIEGALEQLREIAKAAVPPASSDDRLKILKAAEAIAEQRMKAASVDLFSDLETEVVAIAQRFGFKGLQSITIRGNGINLTVSDVVSSYSKQTPGQRLRLRIALVMAMMRIADRSGYGNHPGLLFIDSPGSEELSDDDLVAMMREIGNVATETRNLQIFLASARGKLLQPTVLSANIKHAVKSGTMF